MTLPWVSILTPVYNGWEFLEECALSVFLQEYKLNQAGPALFTWEWLIGVNGHGESGGPALVAAKRVEQLAKVANIEGVGSIRIVNLPSTKGKVAAMNELAAMAAGEWVAVLDCDDTWEREKLVTQWMAAHGEAADAAVIGTLTYYFGEIVSNGPTLPLKWVSPLCLMDLNPMVNSSTILRREHAHWEDNFGLDDYDLWFRIVLAGGKLYNVPLRLTHHRIHAASAFNGKRGQDVNGLIAHYSSALLAAHPLQQA